MMPLTMGETARGEQRILGVEWVPVERAALCLDCESVFRMQRACPACASESWMPLVAVVQRVRVAESRRIPAGKEV